MKLLILLVVVAVATARPDEQYSSRYDDFDVDQLKENPRLMNAYIMCFLGEGKCTPEGNEISTWIPDAINNTCKNCSDKQKVLVAKMIKTMMDDHAEGWEKLKNKYDPEHTHEDVLKQFIGEHLQ
ncbi:allergen Tha p 1-like [Pieris napi]|uniref:allergen Tha p 1-like n=1 Tax=Pieris napi TaxID=78633 RepID=UPI001FBAF7B4|nr:allergen Tha p 1-like [Pieris napi]